MNAMLEATTVAASTHGALAGVQGFALVVARMAPLSQGSRGNAVTAPL
jgi:hypothetical protein